MGGRIRGTARFTWMIVSYSVAQTLVCGVALLPVLVTWWAMFEWTAGRPVARLAAVALAAAPSYGLFAIGLMMVSALASRLTGWQTPREATMRIADLEWPLLNWARYMASIHVVRVLAGSFFRGTPIWTAYLRLNGARLGRRVYIGSLALSDYNVLEFGDDVVIGADVHLSGHTVEGGFVKTGSVRLGSGVMIGVGTVVGIDVEAGPGCQVGALSFVPKHARLEAGTIYAGIPVRRIENGGAQANSGS